MTISPWLNSAGVGTGGRQTSHPAKRLTDKRRRKLTTAAFTNAHTELKCLGLSTFKPSADHMAPAAREDIG
jgi:hypothetical protein